MKQSFMAWNFPFVVLSQHSKSFKFLNILDFGISGKKYSDYTVESFSG
jgi:hypothetical protein